MNNKELDIIFDAEVFGGPQEKEYKDFCKSIKRLSSIKDKGNITQEIIEYREKTNENIPIETDYSFWKKITYIQYLLDLIEQGAVFKKLKKQDGLCLVTSPDKNNFDSYRRILTLRRDDQLRVDSVKDFDNTYIVETEAQLLQTFLGVIEDADVLSGWNSEGYDIPYTVNRILKVLSKDDARQLCLWNLPPRSSRCP